MQFWSKGWLAIAGVAGLSAFCISSASAAPITGTVNISGSVAVGATFIDFQPPVGPPNGAFVVSNSGNTGSFAPLNNTAGTILDLNETVQTPGVTFAPLMGFMTFAADPTIRLDLTSIDPGIFTSTNCFVAPAAGQTCTPPGFTMGSTTVPNPFNLNNTSATTSSATITFRGNAVNAATGETNTFVGIFSTQFTVPYQTLLTEISSGGTVSTSYSATITTAAPPVPEPATLLLLGSGLIGIFVVGRKRLS